MKKVMAILLVAICIALQGCAGCSQDMSELQSVTTGINRVVTLYACDGKVIGCWEGKLNVRLSQGTSVARFMYNGKAIQINGTFTIIEK